MKRLSGTLRLGIVLSVLWLITLSMKYDMWSRWNSFKNNLDDFIAEGVIPLIVFWGLVWIIAGFRNKDDKTEGIEDDKTEDT